MTFEIYRSGFFRREWRWRMRARNGEIVATGEGYQSRGGALHCIDLIRNEAAQAVIRGIEE